jgi:hypothetical protein
MKRLLPILVACLCLTGCAQGDSGKSRVPETYIHMDDTLILNIDSIFGTEDFPSKEEIVKMENSFYQTESNGWGGCYSGWHVQEQIKAVATDNELCSMARFSSVPALRAFAFSVLADKRHEACFDIVCAGISDTATFAMPAFDVIYGRSVAEYMINTSRWDSLFSQQQQFFLDSLLAFTPGLSHLDMQIRLAVNRLSDTLRMYDRIRELYIEGHDNMLVELAQYKKESDKDLFVAALKQYKEGLDRHGARRRKCNKTNCALSGLKDWQDTNFIPLLEEIRDYELKRRYIDYGRLVVLFKAVMAYDDDWAYRFIEDIFVTKQAYKKTMYPELLYQAYYEEPERVRFLPLVNTYAQKPYDWDRNHENK